MVETNPLNQYLLELIDNPNLTDDLNKKAFIKKLKINKKEFNQLVDYLEQFWGLEKISQESWLQFFERAIFKLRSYNNVAQEILQGEIPDNLSELVKELENYEQEIQQAKEKILSQVETQFSQKEADRLIIRLKEKYQGELPEQITPQKIIQAAAEQKISNYTNKTSNVLKLHQRQSKTIIQANAPDSSFSDQELNLITVGSLGENKVWHQTIQQKCDNYAEIIKQIETVADTKTLAQQAEIAEKVQPVVEKHSDIDNPEIAKEISQDIANGLMTAKAQGWELKPIPNTDASVTTPQVALAFKSRNISLKEPLAVSEIVDTASESLSEMPLYSNKVRQINHITLQANVTKHLNNKGLNLTPSQKNQTAESISYGFHIPYTTKTIKQAYSQTHQTKGEEITKPSLLQKLRFIQQSDQALKAFEEDPYKGVFKQIFASHYAQMTPEELKTEISLLNSMRSFARTTTARGPIINLHATQFEAAQTVINHPLYRLSSPLLRLSKSKVAKRLGQTAIGKGFKKAGGWLAQKIGLSGAKAVSEQAITGTIASALGIPSGGASLLVWAGWELLKMGAKKLFGGIKRIFKGIGSATGGFFADIFSGGKTETSRQKAGILKALQKGLYGTGATIGTLISLPSAFNAGPIIVFSFLIFFGLVLLGFLPQQMMTQSRRRPPLGRGGEGVTQAELNINAIEVDLSTCDIPSPNAKKACALSQAFGQCFSEGKITSINSSLVEECIRKTEALMSILSETQINHIVNSISYSANTYGVLQCVGFKRAVEPNLPGCGDAKHFINAGCNRCRPANPLEPGVNAVFTGGAYGHIAIVLEIDQENGLVTLAQAWGGSGRVNFTQVPIASVDEFIDCR